MQKTKRGRIQLGIIALVFIGPMILATWMYRSGQLQPEGSTNHGRLLEPVVELENELPDASPFFNATETPWKLVYAREAGCDPACRDALHRLRQIRLMLGKDMVRIARVYLRDDTQPVDPSLLQQHRGLLTINDTGLQKLLDERRPQDLPDGGIFLVDPLNNLVMYFSPDIIPRDMAEDLKHLLRVSRIG